MRTLSLLIFAPYFPPHVGGLEGYVGDLNEALLDSRGVNRITVFTPKLPADGTPAEQRGEKYVVLRYPAFELIPNFPVPRLWSVSFWQALRRAHPRVHDVFVSHTRFFLTSFFALLSARVVRRPLIHVEHGSDFVELDGRLARRAAYAYDLTLGRLVLRRAEAVVGISRAAAEFVRQLTGRDAPVIYRGMRKARLDVVKPDRELSERAAGRLVVAFAGRLIDGKGVPDLLRALAEAQGPEAFACVVGDGPSRAGLEALAASLGIGDRVWFAGYVSEDRAWSMLGASDIVVNPSYTEGLPTAVLEAALMGKAVLATDVGGTPEIVAHRYSALLVRPRDVRALRAGLEELLADPALRRQLGEAARSETLARFDWPKSAAQFLEVARGLVTDHAGDGSGAASTSSKIDS